MYKNKKELLTRAYEVASGVSVIVTEADHETIQYGREIWRESTQNGERARVVAIQESDVKLAEMRANSAGKYFHKVK